MSALDLHREGDCGDGCPMCAYDDARPAPVCPESVAGKHGNCDGTAWDDTYDAPTTCECECRDEEDDESGTP